ncbi:putative H(+)-transporting two-sector ATPase [Helianthus annuus]|nr:putative H(+)-transporting two-sector ATPase [Helianthus annuus]
MGENGWKKKLEGMNGLFIANPYISNPTNPNHVFTAAPRHTPPPLPPPLPRHQILRRTRLFHSPSPPPPHFTRYTTYSTSTAAPSPLSPTTVAGSHDGKITDEFTGAGAIGQVCEVIDAVVDVGFS